MSKANTERLVLGVEYDGGGFSGWQWQLNQRTVQQILEQALSKIANHSVTVQCAGRTDAGVHALEQVVHFDARVNRALSAWQLGGNSRLPDDVRITWARLAVDDFHARYSAVARFYRYIILNRPYKSALLRKQVTCYHLPLDADKMHTAAQFLIGKHDFSTFRATACQSKSPCRAMYFIDVYREDEKVIIDLCANAFLHHMVRNIAGALIAIGADKQPIDWMHHLLEIKCRKQGGVTAPPDGLYLGGVYYPDRFQIPKHLLFNKLPKDAKRFD